MTVPTFLTFKIWDQPTGGDVLWIDTQTVTPDTEGRFSVMLGSFADHVFSGAETYLGMTAESDPEMTPRQQLVSVPYALRSGSEHWILNQNSALITDNVLGLGRLTDTLWGPNRFSHVNLGIWSATGQAGDEASNATVGGGSHNRAGDDGSTVSGGRVNYADGVYATIAGGWENTASGNSAVISGGGGNTATNLYSTILGGYGHLASGISATVAGGYGDTATGYNAMVAGGRGNVAAGQYSFAAGHNGKANHDGAFVWGGGGLADFASTGAEQFLIRSTGGVGINLTDPTADLDVNGQLRIRGGNPGTGKVLTSAADGTATWEMPGASTGYWILSSKVMETSGQYGLVRAGSIIGGIYDSTHVNLGVNSTITGVDVGLSYKYATISGGVSNKASAWSATVAGGAWNEAGDSSATVSGGAYNAALGKYSVVAGGVGDSATGMGATISGGANNRIIGMWLGVIGGGLDNLVSGDTAATVAGGAGNQATASMTSIGGGIGNRASGPKSTIAGGDSNWADGGHSAIAGGFYNQSAGSYSFVGGGKGNSASGYGSFTAGLFASALHTGSFVWADSSAEYSENSSAKNQWTVRSTGGVRFFTDAVTPHAAGVQLSAGGSSWSSVSDSTAKRNIRPVNGDDILAALAELPISRWSYKTQDESIEHIGPMAQDFYRLFGLGEDDTHINSLDPDGIALAAIKALDEIVRNQRIEIEQLQAKANEVDALKTQIAEIRAAMADLVEQQNSEARLGQADLTAASQGR